MWVNLSWSSCQDRENDAPGLPLRIVHPLENPRLLSLYLHPVGEPVSVLGRLRFPVYFLLVLAVYLLSR